MTPNKTSKLTRPKVVALPAIIDRLDEVDPQDRCHYVQYPGNEDDMKGKLMLCIEPSEEGFALERVAGLKKALEHEKEHRRLVTAKLNAIATLIADGADSPEFRSAIGSLLNGKATTRQW